MHKSINVMKRYELKYHLNKNQLLYFQESISRYMELDQYGLTSIESLYFDTPTSTLLNRSIEKPQYKEKIRLRSYGLANSDSTLYLEIKRKLEGIVYKRRIPLKENEAYELINNQRMIKDDQINHELLEFIKKYPLLKPQYLVIYDRLAYYQKDSDIRITIDKNPRYRVNDLNLHTSLEGMKLLGEDEAILEIKVQSSLPLWLVKILSEGKIYETSFSKVGRAYQLEMNNQHQKASYQPAMINKKGENYRYGLAI